jgi:hypothetical protein
VPSWIWKTSLQDPTPGDNKGLSLTLQVEWCKAQERAVRYEEEVQLVAEEMRRTTVFFLWLAREWESRAITPTVGSLADDGIATAGIFAYAYKQVAVYHKMIEVFVTDWYECLENKLLGSPWLHSHPSPPQPNNAALFRWHICTIPPLHSRMQALSPVLRSAQILKGTQTLKGMI